MPATVIVGLQWGDEGKGKTTDFLAEQVAMVVRYQGGDNAGHTVVSGDEVFKLRLTPSGVLYPHITSVIGNGVVVNPVTLIDELDMLASRGIDVVARPGQPQRARDHAVPRRARRRQRGAPGRRQGRHDGSWHRPDLRRPGVAARPADGGPPRPGRPARADRARAARQEPPARRDGRPDASRSTPLVDEAARLGRAAARPPRRHDLARPGGARARRARPARGRPGHAARPRPRELPVRDLVEPGRRRRVHRWRDRAAPGRRGHRRDEGLLDARRLGAVPDRAARRDRRRDRRSAATSSGRSPGVRGGSAGSTPSRCATRSRSTASAASCSTSSTSCPASRRSGCASPTRSTAGGSRRWPSSGAALVAGDADLRRVPGLGGADQRRPLAGRPARERPALRVGASRSTPASRSCSCRSGRSGPRRSSGPGGRCATARGCRREPR